MMPLPARAGSLSFPPVLFRVSGFSVSLWFHLTVRCSVCLETLYVEILCNLGCFSPEQAGICFGRYSPGSLGHMESLSLCVCDSGSVNPCSHFLGRQVCHSAFSREYCFPSTEKKHDTQAVSLKSFLVEWCYF